MATNTLLPASVLTLGGFLRDRRARLPPAPDAATRRRTPGLRREEVATRAGVSAVWYTWLEQGRGGPPSDQVLERLSHALELDSAGREILFLLARQRPPPLHPAPPSPVSPALQRVLDSMTTSPVTVKTPTWDIVAWNRAALAVLTNFAMLPAGQRNVLRRLFGSADVRASMPDWESDARFAVAVFRLDVARAGGGDAAAALAAELQATSADFRRFWAENETRNKWAGVKRIDHPVAGPIALEFSAFAVEGSEGLSMMVFTPVSPADVRAVELLLSRPD